jgi:ABC-type sugar transport system permease subunit
VAGVFWWSVQKGGFTGEREFVGLRNFEQVFGGLTTQAAVQNTLAFAVLSVPLTIILALGLASLLARIGRGASAFRFLVYFPVLVPGVVAGLIWLVVTNSQFGLLNSILGAVGLPGQTWLGPRTALPVVAALDVWRNVGYWSIFFLAAMVGISRELYEAAHLDGAGPFQRFAHVTVPQIRRVLLFAVVIATIVGLNVFDTVLVLTNGGPGTATITAVLYVYQYVFGYGLVGLGAAISVLLLVATLLLTLVQIRLGRGREVG